jgi:hypothetical protein
VNLLPVQHPINWLRWKLYHKKLMRFANQFRYGTPPDPKRH